MKKTLFILWVMACGGAVPISCLPPCGGGDGPNTFTIVKLGLRTANTSLAEIDATQTHPFDNACKVIHIPEWKMISHHVVNSPPAFYTAAFACSPAPLLAIEKFQDIRVTSLTSVFLRDTNDAVQAGQDITDRFEIHDHQYLTDYIPIADYLDSELKLYRTEFTIRLAEKPYQEVNMKLKISIMLTDNRIFEFDNETLNVR